MTGDWRKWSLDDLLPHRPPMVLIDAVEAFDAEARSLKARVVITPEQMFFFRGRSGGGVPSWAAIEYMAQASAALVGLWDRMQTPQRPSRPGLLLGTRRLELRLDRFEEGGTYHVTAENAFCDSDAASFACAIMDDDGKEVATATLNAYRPPDIAQFLKEQTGR